MFFWDEILERKVDSEVQGQVIGVQTQIQSFNFSFEIQLGVLVLRHTDNLSSILQYSYMSMVVQVWLFSTFLWLFRRMLKVV